MFSVKCKGLAKGSFKSLDRNTKGSKNKMRIKMILHFEYHHGMKEVPRQLLVNVLIVNKLCNVYLIYVPRWLQVRTKMLLNLNAF